MSQTEFIKISDFESINKNDAMTLREVADRLGMSYVRVKQIQDQVINKISDMRWFIPNLFEAY